MIVVTSTIGRTGSDLLPRPPENENIYRKETSLLPTASYIAGLRDTSICQSFGPW
jgi:hypothetical protein